MRISKIIVALLVSVVAVTAMTGIAVANPATVIITADPIVNPLDGSTVTTTTVTVTVLDGDVGTRYLSVISSLGDLSLKVNGTDPDSTYIDTGWGNLTRNGTTYNVTANATNGPSETYTFTVWVFGSSEGYVTVADNLGTNYDPAASADSASCTRKVMVPEFATIAIPAIAVLGLFLFFNKRKHKKD